MWTRRRTFKRERSTHFNRVLESVRTFISSRQHSSASPSFGTARASRLALFFGGASRRAVRNRGSADDSSHNGKESDEGDTHRDLSVFGCRMEVGSEDVSRLDLLVGLDGDPGHAEMPGFL